MSKKTLSLLLIAGASFFFQVTAFAATWNFTWVSSDDTRYFFDSDTVEKSKNVVIIWVKTVQIRQVEKDGSWSTAYRWRINCPKRTIQTLAWSTYDDAGKFIKSGSNPSAEDLVTPDTTGDAMLKVACAANFPRDTSEKYYFKLDNVDVFQATKNYEVYRKSRIDTAPK